MFKATTSRTPSDTLEEYETTSLTASATPEAQFVKTVRTYAIFFTMTFAPASFALVFLMKGSLPTYFKHFLGENDVPLPMLAELNWVAWLSVLILLGSASYCAWAHTAANELGRASAVDKRYGMICTGIYLLQLCSFYFWLYLMITKRPGHVDPVTVTSVGTAVWSFSICSLLLFTGAQRMSGLLCFPFVMWVCYILVVNLMIAYKRCVEFTDVQFKDI